MGIKLFKTEILFGSKTRSRLLALLLLQENEAFFVRELSRLIGAQLNSVRRELKHLTDLGIVEEKIPEQSDEPKNLSERKKFYTVNTSHMMYNDLRALFKKAELLHRRSFLDDLIDQDELVYVALTGKFIDKPELPTDILLIGKVDSDRVHEAISRLEQEVGHEINYTVISPEEAEYRKHVMDRFLLSLLNSENIVLLNTNNL